ncbi:MAG: UDP-N-acetylglucosamine 2-epimerase (hydrolyzing) [Cytophagaceae bacterium]|nr:UDP-N-acetylglucosamine 2-epimerase (hydrolyzing) [Cytophagaceae bacterium]
MARYYRQSSYKRFYRRRTDRNLKKICFVTGTWAEFGLLSPLMRLFQKDDTFELQIVATGMHLSPEFGLTYKEIEKEGFFINEKVEILLSSDTKAGMVKSTGLALLSFPDVFTRLSPEIVIVLGDRYETFAATTAAFMMQIPVVHISGGDVTEGAIDDALRHSISKMSALHFTALEAYRKRVLQLGEQPSTVFNVGALGIDNIKNLNLLDIHDLRKSIDWNELENYFLLTLHPVTLESESIENQMNQLFDALNAFPEIKVLFTLPNSDSDGRKIIELIKNYSALEPTRIKYFTSLGQLRYLSAAKNALAVVGNSSSGIVEIPSLGVPTVNIGKRQSGREAAESVINCDAQKDAIIDALKLAISTSFQDKIKSIKNIYGEGNTASKIFEIIKNHKFEEISKSFTI